MLRSRSNRWTMVLTAAAIGALAATLVGPATANHQPANKIAVAGSGLESMQVALVEGSTSEEISLMSSTLRSSNPTDLIFEVTAECALFTDVIIRTPAEAGGTDSSEAVATVKVWVEIDGQPVAVATDDTGEEAGKVVFCNRAQYSRVTIGPDDDDEDDHEFEQYIRSKTANAFNWIALNVGSGIHQIEVKAQLEASVTGAGAAEAFVGKRTLVVQPEKLANDATI